METTDIKQRVGQQIREARLKAGLTQKEVGAKLGVTEGAYNRYESGQQNLTIDTIHKICKAIGVDFKTIIE